MDKIFKFINCVFKFTWEIQKKIIRSTAKRTISLKYQKTLYLVQLCSFIMFLILASLAAYTKLSKNIFPILWVVILIYLIISFFRIAETPFISIRGFVKNGILMLVTMALGILMILFTFSKSLNFSTFKQWIAVNVVFLFLWCGYSLLANNKMSKLINTCNAAFFAIFSLVFNLILNWLPDDFNYGDIFKNIEMPGGYSYKQVLTSICATLLIFPLITNILAATLCAVKGYWIEKYNDGNDISQEMIDKEIQRIKAATELGKHRELETIK